MTRKEFITSPTYWLTQMQIDIFREIKTYQAVNKMNDEELAEFLDISTYKLRQITSGDCNLDMNELCEIMVRIDVAPKLSLMKIDDYDK